MREIEWPKGELVVVDMATSSPVAYINVYEEGDVWIKVQGCEACKMPAPKRCCGECPFATEKGCWWQLEKASVSSKPLVCIALPRITKRRTSDCTLIYRCVAGSMKGKIRRVFDDSDVFIDGNC
jgi:hypothetical protein